MKTHYLFDKTSRHWNNWQGAKLGWLLKYPQTLCWRSVKGLTIVKENATCKKCLQILETNKFCGCEKIQQYEHKRL